MSEQKVTITMRVAIHPIKAEIWKNRHKINSNTSLREIGKLIGVESPQKIKHHLEQMVKMGSVDYVKGQYLFPK